MWGGSMCCAVPGLPLTRTDGSTQDPGPSSSWHNLPCSYWLIMLAVAAVRVLCLLPASPRRSRPEHQRRAAHHPLFVLQRPLHSIIWGSARAQELRCWADTSGGESIDRSVAPLLTTVLPDRSLNAQRGGLHVLSCGFLLGVPLI